MGAVQAMQQFAILQGEFHRVYVGQHQSAPATPVHQGKEQSAGEGAGGADRVHGLLAPEGRNQWFRGASVFDPTLFLNHARMKVTEVNSTRQVEGGIQSQAVSSERRQLNNKDKISVGAENCEWTSLHFGKISKQMQAAMGRTRAPFK